MSCTPDPTNWNWKLRIRIFTISWTIKCKLYKHFFLLNKIWLVKKNRENLGFDSSKLEDFCAQNHFLFIYELSWKTVSLKVPRAQSHFSKSYLNIFEKCFHLISSGENVLLHTAIFWWLKLPKHSKIMPNLCRPGIIPNQGLTLIYIPV